MVAHERWSLTRGGRKGRFDCIPKIGNNAAEGENYIKYANSYLMNCTVNNCFVQDIFESLWRDIISSQTVLMLGRMLGLSRAHTRIEGHSVQELSS